MTKRKAPDTKKYTPSRPSAKAGGPTAGPEEPNWLSSAAMRETIESVIIAFVLAFLFRTFEAEAFVIPTGSMAPTLMGKHKDLECPMCHYRYQANASDDQRENKPAAITSTICPICHFDANVGPGNPQSENYESYDGDRILVAKFPYEFADPKRWDVVVFRYPGNSTMNYIKRLVGLPGETIRIHDGDLWIRGSDPKDTEFQIARKPPAKILAMLQLVYDNDLAPVLSNKNELNLPTRWTPDERDNESKWNESSDLTSFATQGGNAESWIRYRHRVPTREMWSATADAGRVPMMDRPNLNREKWLKLLHDNPAVPASVPPRLISDFAAYNTSVPSSEYSNGLHWVGDLAVQFDLESQSATGEVLAELVKGGRHFQCRINLASGEATLTISGNEPEAVQFRPTASTSVKGAGRHAVMFSNVDDQLRLWIDGSLVKFGDDKGTETDTATAFDSAKLPDRIPTQDDLAPVRIGSKSAAARVSHIKIFRDVYYIAVFNPGPSRQGGPLADFKVVPSMANPQGWKLLSPDLANPKDWESEFSAGPNGNMASVDIPLRAKDPSHPEKDQFLVLGDNSPQSQDGRLWCTDDRWLAGERDYWVDRELFIGKALFIYWPHGWGIPHVPLPFNPIPNFRRMHLVR